MNIVKFLSLFVVFISYHNVLAESVCPTTFSHFTGQESQGELADKLSPILQGVEKEYGIELNSNAPSRLASVILQLRETLTPEQKQKLASYGLRLSVMRENIEEIKMFLSKGADVNTTGLLGYSAIDWAREIERPDIVALLEGRE